MDYERILEQFSAAQEGLTKVMQDDHGLLPAINSSKNKARPKRKPRPRKSQR